MCMRVHHILELTILAMLSKPSLLTLVLGDINIARDDYCQPTILRLLRCTYNIAIIAIIAHLENYKLIII